MDATPHSGTEQEKPKSMADVTPEPTMEIGTVDQILEAAPGDIVTEVIDVPEWGCAVKLKSFTAYEAASIRQAGIGFRGENTEVAWAQMEKQQFLLGVMEPSFTPNQVEKLHMSSGRGFARVIQWLDEKSNIDKEALKSAREEFLGSDEPEEV